MIGRYIRVDIFVTTKLQVQIGMTFYRMMLRIASTVQSQDVCPSVTPIFCVIG